MILWLWDIEKYSREQYLEAFDMVKNGTLHSKKKEIQKEIREIILGIRFFRRKYSMQIQDILDLQQMIDHITETSTDIVDVKIMSWLQKQFSYCGKELEILEAINNTAVVQIVDKNGIILHINEIYQEVSGDTRNLHGKNIKALGWGKHHPPEFWKDMWDTILSWQVWQGVIKNPRMDNDGFYYVHTTITPVKGNNGEYNGRQLIRSTLRKKVANATLFEEKYFG